MQVNIFVNGAALDSVQFVWNCIFLFVQIKCNACYTYGVPTETKLPVPVDLDIFIHLLVIIAIAVV